MSACPPENLKNRCLLRFLASHMTHLSYLLFRLPVLNEPQTPSCTRIVTRAKRVDMVLFLLLLSLSVLLELVDAPKRAHGLDQAAESPREQRRHVCH